MTRFITTLQSLPRARVVLTVVAAGIFALGSAVVVFGGVAADTDRDGAVSVAFTIARQRGEVAPGVVTAQRSDAAALRASGHEVPAMLSGQLWFVTLRGSFDIGKRPPSGPYADPSNGKGIYSRLEVIVQDGTVVGPA